MATQNRTTDRHNALIASGVVGFALNKLPGEILTDTRGNKDIASARQVAMYLAYVGFGMSLSRVAYAFGRDRSTVAHACHVIEDRRDDLGFDSWLDGLEEVLKQLAPLCERKCA
ncbi:MAG: helix-turn-helix domain-containing protein [Hyphomonadaceae bacterium]